MINYALIQIDGILIPNNYILRSGYEVAFNTLWGADTGRDMAGNENGTLIGMFPKVSVTFRKLNRDEMKYVLSLLNRVNFQLTYYDPEKDMLLTLPNYRADFSVPLISTKNVKYESFKVDFIPRRKR